MNNTLTQKIIGAAIEVHKTRGPGLLEPAYQECLLFELKTVECFTDVHFAQTLTYMKFRKLPFRIINQFSYKTFKKRSKTIY